MTIKANKYELTSDSHNLYCARLHKVLDVAVTMHPPITCQL